jgi:hypothetical protein
MIQMIPGIVRGKTVELASDPGFSEGQEVEVILRPSGVTRDSTWGEGLRRCAGALADSWTEEDDRILDEIARERRSDTRPELTD